VPIASSWNDVPVLLIAAALVVGATAFAVHLFGRRLAKRSRTLAVFSCAVTAPVLIAAVAVFSLAIAPQGPPPNDEPAMLFMALTTLALFACVVSVPASVLLLTRKAYLGKHSLSTSRPPFSRVSFPKADISLTPILQSVA
jgi:hypothetical protein